MQWYRDEDAGVGACSGTEMKTQVWVQAVVQRWRHRCWCMQWYRDEDTGVGACSGTEMKTQVLVHAVVQR